MLQLLGEKFLKSGQIDGKDAIMEIDQKLSNNNLIGLYFSASWCGPCQYFTPKLQNYYNMWKSQNQSFELVYVSSDRSEGEFVQYFFHKMNWLAIPWSDKMRLSLLGKLFRPPGIPTLVILDNQGAMLTKDGKYDIEMKKDQAIHYWESLRQQRLSDQQQQQNNSNKN